MRSCRIVRAQWALSCCLSVFGQKSKRGDLRVNKADFLETNTAKFHYVTEPFNVISKACRLVTTGCFWVFLVFFVVALWNVTTKSAQRSLHEKKRCRHHTSSRVEQVSLPTLMLQCRRSVDEILNCQQQATWACNGPQLYSSECANMHGRTHAHARRKKEKSCATPPSLPSSPLPIYTVTHRSAAI